MIDVSLGVKQMMDFSKSHCPTTTSFFDSDSEEDDDFFSVSRNGFGLRPGPSTGSSLSPSFATWNSSFDYHGRSDRISLIAKINKIIKENERSVLHAVEVASARVTQLESRTRCLENSMDDLKVCIEYNHGRTLGKLRELESIMKEVHTDVKLLLGKQETAETELQLLKFQCCRTATEHETKNNDVQITFPHQKSSLSSCKSYQPVLSSAYENFQQQSTQLNLVQVGSEGSRCSEYANLPHLNHPPPQAPIVPSISHESYYSNFVHPQVLLHSHPPPCFSPRSQYTPNCQNFELYPESEREQEKSTLHPSSQNSYDDSDLKSWQYSLQALPQALPKACFLDGGKVSKTTNEGIVEEIIAMGFRRDLVLAAVKKMKQKQEPVDLNSLLDKLMN